MKMAGYRRGVCSAGAHWLHLTCSPYLTCPPYLTCSPHLTCLPHLTCHHHLHSHTPFTSGRIETPTRPRDPGGEGGRSVSQAVAINPNITPPPTPPPPSPLHHKYVQPSSWTQLLMDFFNFSSTTVYKMGMRNKRLKNCDIHTLTANINIMLKYKVSPGEVRHRLALLYRSPCRTEHNIAILIELGLLNLSADLYLQFPHLQKTMISSLKRSELLPADYDPAQSVLVAMGVPIHHIPPNLSPKQLDSLPLHQVHDILSDEYLSWQLGCSKIVVNNMKKLYNMSRKSLQVQQEVVGKLYHHWDVTTEKILQNGYLLGCSAINLDHITSEVKMMAGVRLKDLVMLTPRILTISYDHLIQVDDILQRLQVSQSAVKSLPRICTLKPETLQNRISQLEQIPELGALQTHPRKLRLIMYYKKIQSRLDFLQTVKSSSSLPSLNRLSGNAQMFHKYLKVGNLRQNHRDAVTCIAEHFNVPRSMVRQNIHHRSWAPHSTAINVQRNLAHLAEAGFSDAQVFSALDVLLYPSDLVRDQLQHLPLRSHAQPYAHTRSSNVVLQLLLYYMDKNSA